ncbi:MAG: MerR family transcriptional regulator [Chloroflexota bacterium]|nr:MerR family transcriptional regulator [Chloroflexota bacterium]MDQ6908907.1 MerR family transcriptional regulator [Chloroflexota bacterium]
MQDKGPLYVISVASRLLALHPQTLRKYERAGFVAPSRTDGNLRLYSPEDLALLRQVKHLVDEHGVNLAGVELALTVTRLAEHLLDLVEHEGNSAKLRRDTQETAMEILRTLGAMSNEH